jgi:FlaA1/EpsC-like NDP-sugar epimerase
MLINTLRQSISDLPRLYKRVFAIYCDIIFCIFSTWFAFGIRLDQWGSLQGEQWWALVFAITLCLPLFVRFGLYRAIFRHIGSAALVTITKVFVIYTSMYFFVFTVIGIDEIPRSIGILQPMSLFLLTGASRYFVRYWLGWSFVNEARYSRPKATALIYGAGSNGRQLNAALASSHEILVKGFVDDDLSLQGSTINNVPIYGGNKLSDLIQHLNITDIILAIPSAGQRRRSEIISSLSGYGVRVRTLPALFNMSSGQVSSSDMHELDMNDLLGRQVVPPNIDLLEKNIKNKVILVTGAGGSIGTELCHQIINLSPKSLVLVDSSEHALYLISQKLENIVGGQEYLDKNPDSNKTLPIKIFPYLASIRDRELITHIFANHRPETVFHAAAYKHVPLLEQNVSEGIRNNVYGTLICAQIARKFYVSNFVLISTDKAVRPTNVMGASKRIAELILQSMSQLASEGVHHTKLSMVRFGNVLGSSGSVAPLFGAQIKSGGPITLTHPEVTRYFMTIPEAAQLVIQSSAMAIGGDVFVLDMGEPVRIYDLALKMIYLSGLIVKDEKNLNGDIEIKITGLRPGEKLYEELLIGDNPQVTSHLKIMKAHEEFLPWGDLQHELENLNLALDSGDIQLIRNMLKKLVPGYQPNDDVANWNGGGIS